MIFVPATHHTRLDTRSNDQKVRILCGFRGVEVRARGEIEKPLHEAQSLIEWYLSTVPPTRWVWHKAFSKWVRCRAVVQTAPAAPKMPLSQLHSSKEGCLRHQTINPAPPRRVSAWGTALLGLTIAVKAYHDRLPSQHTRPDPCMPKHGRSKCVVAWYAFIYSQCETLIGSFLYSWILGRLICQYHYSDLDTHVLQFYSYARLSQLI